MNKSVLISIRPEWCDLIASGKKTIEVRKTRPKIETPFMCYIYCTQSGKYKDGKSVKNIWLNRGTDKRFIGNGKVIGEFICRGIMQPFDSLRLMAKESCLTEEELLTYSNGKTLYGWRIADLKIYDKPRELSEFYVHKYDTNDYCIGCPHHECPDAEYPCCKCIADERNRAYLYRPPQSWQYVEELEE